MKRMAQGAWSIALFAVLLGCGAKAPRAVVTETNLGEAVVMTEAPRTADRKDVPAGVTPADVIAVIKTPEGGKVWIVKQPRKHPLADKKVAVYRNEQAQAQGITAERPKRSRAWIWIGIGIVVLVGGAILAREKIKGPLSAAWAIITRIVKR